MDLDAVGRKLDGYLYRRVFKKLSPEDLRSAKTWCLDVIRQNHPTLTDAQAERYYDSLINVKVTVVDEWSQRMGQ